MYWDKIVPQCKNMGWLALGLISLVIVIMLILFLFLWLLGLILGLLNSASRSGMTSPEQSQPTVDPINVLLRFLGLNDAQQRRFVHKWKKNHSD